ncbi:MAG: S46 family peptidase [bacterium]
MKHVVSKLWLVVALSAMIFLIGCSSQQAVKPEVGKGLVNVKAGEFDTGKMWTFDFPPMDYFKKTYNFNPTKEWFEKARLSALRLPGCTAAFVSEDGLVMTNHHCARGDLQAANKEGEQLHINGFYAPTLDDERKTRSYVDQLIVTDDVTMEIQKAFDSGTTEAEKASLRGQKMTEIISRYTMKYKESTKDSMTFQIVTFYNGGRYSLYGYKRYTDIRLVFAPEEVMAFFGGDPDNFTYPRYDMDISIYRVYENGKPVKTSNFFKFSKEGAKEGEAVFVLGNPGGTGRLLPISQLETLRDITYPANINFLETQVNAYTQYIEKNPDKKSQYLNTLFGMANSRKAITGYLTGLTDPVFWAKKLDFEKNFRNTVVNNPGLKAKYGDPWSQMALYEAELQSLLPEANALNVSRRSQYFSLAINAVAYADSVKAGKNKPKPRYMRMSPIEVDNIATIDLLAFMQKSLGTDYPALKALMKNRTPVEVVEDFVKNSAAASKEKFETLVNGSPDAILGSTDPLVAFVVQTRGRLAQLQFKIGDLRAKQAPLIQLLGRAMYDVNGTKIPPDATFTLRMADGVVKGYEYNGTIAPPVTTFYGLYDRYYSFSKKDPWELPQRWVNTPADFNLSTPMNFVSTNDIIGGNSGSSVVNKNLEVVGLIFDGNIESLPGYVIFDETKNRSVSVHSAGILEALEKMYRADRIVKELRQGKMAQ